MIAEATKIVYDEALREIRLDLSTPFKVRVVGVNEKTGREKEYFLKVTERGGIVLV